MSIADVKKTTEHKMQKSLEALRVDLAKVRTGRAHIGLLDHVQVDYYGSMVPINTVAKQGAEGNPTTAARTSAMILSRREFPSSNTAPPAVRFGSLIDITLLRGCE